MGRVTDSWSGKQKFHKGFGRKGNTKLDAYQRMLLEMEGKEWKPKVPPSLNPELSFEERLKRAGVRKRKPTKAYKRWLKKQKDDR